MPHTRQSRMNQLKNILGIIATSFTFVTIISLMLVLA